MNQYFDDLKEVIPEDIYTRTKTFMAKEIVIFQPEEFVPELKITTNDYNFIMFHSNPPLSKIGTKEYQFNKGNLIVLEPDVDFSNLSKSNKLPGKYTSITIKKKYLRSFALEALGKDNLKLKIQNSYSSNLLETVEKFKFEITNFGEDCPLMLQCISTQLIIELLRDINDDGIGNFKQTNGVSYIKKAIDYMQCYYNSNITIEDISSHFHISTYHFQRIFKQHTGDTPYQYLMKIRIRKAVELLNSQHYSMGEIARLCGFINQSHFSTVFKQSIGTPPSEYRKTFGSTVSK